MAIDLNKLTFDEKGLIPAIIQDVQSKAVLMMAYMNKESLLKTMESGQTWFWSRSRQELWHKGATSGHIQQVKHISHDCDQDTLLIQVVPAGPACHRDTYTCFDGGSMAINTSSDIDDEATQGLQYQVLSELIETIAKRDAERPEGAYTTYLYEQGVDKILKKVGEESAEVIIAAKNRDAQELSNESADLIYHLMVLWREQNLGFEQIISILRQRHSVPQDKGGTS